MQLDFFRFLLFLMEVGLLMEPRIAVCRKKVFMEHVWNSGPVDTADPDVCWNARREIETTQDRTVSEIQTNKCCNNDQVMNKPVRREP